jgi:dienelactone hydrolase
MASPVSFALPTSTGKLLHGCLHDPGQAGPRPTIVVCHGFKGFMDWGFFPYLADLLANRGFLIVRFNFSGSGMLPGDELVTDPEAFRTATHSQDLAELLELLEALGSRIAGDRVDHRRIGLFGHSRGGGTALLGAAQRPWRHELGAIVTWAAVASFDRLSAEEKANWRSRGSVPVVNARTGQELSVDVEVLEDLERRPSELDPEIAAARLRAPWLILHGEQDETVPAQAAHLLASAATAEHELRVVPGAGHTFGARHPFDGPTPELIEALNQTQAWFREHLG